MDFRDEHIIARIRQKLQDDRVKLWTVPYYENDAAVEEKLKVKVDDTFYFF